MNAVRKRRLIIVGLVLAAVAVAVALSMFALQRNVTYMFSPTEVDAGKAPVGSTFRLGGIVEEGSIKHVKGTLKVDFVVTDRFHDMPVVYTGILPDLFREGQSVVTTGHMRGDRFVATQVLAKHDETYMPPEVAADIKKAEKAGRAHAEARAKALKTADENAGGTGTDTAGAH
ncbi:MAG TPA: cytochrome c maturation protein CcmE [Rhodanobacteraceae bacterium]